MTEKHVDAPPQGLDDDALAKRSTVFAPGSFSGKAVLITGGAGGLGRACGWLLGRLGARVTLAGRSGEKVLAAAAAMTARGLDVRALTVDIRDQESVDRMFLRMQELGGFDLLVNSAGGQFPQAAIDFSPRGWDAVINTNLNGVWRTMQGAARFWRDAGKPGNIINIVVVTRQGLHGIAHSIAARAGVIGLSQALAVEWAPLGVRVNCIAPGVIETPGWRVYDPAVIAAYPRSNPMMRAGDSWDVAEACAYLGGDASGYVTGDLLHVAGGAQLWGETWTIPRPAWFGETNAPAGE